MKARLFCLLTQLVVVTAGHAQGTLIFDQESSSDETVLGGLLPIQAYTSLGQSFTPSLSTVGFVWLRLSDINPGNSNGATLIVNLRAASMAGTIIGTSQVALADGFAGPVNFLFETAVTVTPSSTYFLEAAVQSGDSWAITILGNTYPSGTVFQDGFPASGNDLWFREGIIVPEPSGPLIVLVGSIVVAAFRRRICRC